MHILEASDEKDSEQVAAAAMTFSEQPMLVKTLQG